MVSNMKTALFFFTVLSFGMGTVLTVHAWGLHKDQMKCEQAVYDSADMSYIFLNGRLKPDAETNISADCRLYVEKTKLINKIIK